MREIKYQAFTDEGMINVTRIAFAGDVVYVISDNDDHEGYEFQIEPHRLRQYTGLKDKNGKEIYEGDILKAKVGQGVMEWDTGRNGWSTFAPLDRFEVIGNIYENQELLK